jgi:hypothetical protein
VTEQGEPSGVAPDVERRLSAVEEQLAALQALVEQTYERMAQIESRIEEGLAHEPARGSAEGGRGPAVSPRMAEVVQLVHEGQGEEAQRRLRAIPEEELSAQPAVVALVASALFVQRGDFEAALKALERARTLTDDPRLLRIIQMVGAQAQ